MKIEVKVQTKYGRDLIYPVNEQALYFTELLMTKTFSIRELGIIQRLGGEVIQVDGFSILNIEQELKKAS